jgi:hypothetical protein
MQKKRVFLYLLFLFLCFRAGVSNITAYTQDSFGAEFFNFPENYEIRRQIKDEVLESLLDVRQSVQYFPVWGKDYRVKFEKFIRGRDLFYSFITETEKGFHLDSQGTYIIKRSMENGTFQWMKVVLRNEPYCYLKIVPDGQRCVLELFLFNEPVYRNIVLPIDFTVLMFEPFLKVVRLTENSIDWQLILYQGKSEDYRDVGNVLEKILTLHDRVKEVEDGAQNSNGDFVFIESGDRQENPHGFNCSGFAKWVVDGFYKPLAGSYIDINTLKQKHETLRGNRWNKEYYKYRDLYFGLDWTRNLAAGLEEARSQVAPSFEAADVRSVKFFQYREDSGYQVKHLKLIMFILAATDPGNFYLGSVNMIYPKNPLLHSHFHVAVLFPYFDELGVFRLVELDQHKEKTIDEFISLYRDDFIHLVRINASGVFSPDTP